MVEDAHGLDLLVRAGFLDESGAGHPLARHLLGLSPPSPHAEGEGHEQEVDVSVFDLATRMHKLDTCYEWAAESKAHAEDLLFGARPRVIWWWQRSPRAQHSYPLEHAFLSADTCVHAFHIERAVCEKLCLIGPDLCFSPKEGIFVSFISCIFLSQLGDISGDFFAHTSLGVRQTFNFFSKVAVGSRKAESRAKVAVPGGGGGGGGVGSSSRAHMNKCHSS